jgi:hypothetical protein
VNRDLEAIAVKLQERLRSEFPNIAVRLKRWEKDPSRAAIYFIDPHFIRLYPLQRYHHLSHLLPDEYMERLGLANAVWFELAPEEQLNEIEHPDEALIREITPDVLAALKRTEYYQALDDVLCPTSNQTAKVCEGDFAISKSLLLSRGFSDSDLDDVFNVLMLHGAFCDCEILYNIAEESRLKSQHWKREHRSRDW